MSAPGGEAEGDFELNIAPIVDCFTVLIAYLLVSMSFISLAIIEAGVSATGPAPEVAALSPPPEIPLNLSVELQADDRLQLKLTGGPTHLDQALTLAPGRSGWDLDGLKSRLFQLKRDYPRIQDVNVSADPAIRYRAIIRVIEAVKTEIPKVFLASS